MHPCRIIAECLFTANKHVNMQKILIRFTVVWMGLFLTGSLKAVDPDAPVLGAYRFKEAPVIDGEMDEMWEALPWYSLNYVWLNWEEEVDSADYYGQFKLAWSREHQLLYFYVEITDDVLVERFPEFQNRPFFNDILEVFLDEDASGGLHVFDGEGNAENAFSYHITPLEYPGPDTPASRFTVIDRDGTGQEDAKVMDYVGHFPELLLYKKGNSHVWEFSLKVFTDAYEYDAPAGTESHLEVGKKMGIALAYCDTDLTEEYRRELFLGSFPGNAQKLVTADNKLFGYNDVWKNADDYNLLLLKEAYE